MLARPMKGYLVGHIQSATRSASADATRSSGLSKLAAGPARQTKGNTAHREPVILRNKGGSSTSQNAGPTRKTAAALKRSPLYPKHPFVELSALPRLDRDQAPRLLFKGIEYDTAISAFHRPSSPTTPLCVYRDSLINLRAMPSTALTARSLSPFPQSLPSLETRLPHARIIQFGVVASKNNVSNLAVERLRARKRFKAAVEAVVQRSIGLPLDQNGLDYLRPDWSYLVMLSRGVYEASMKELCESVAEGLKFIKRLQDRGIGDERQLQGAGSTHNEPIQTRKKSLTDRSGVYNRRDAS